MKSQNEIDLETALWPEAAVKVNPNPFEKKWKNLEKLMNGIAWKRRLYESIPNESGTFYEWRYWEPAFVRGALQIRSDCEKGTFTTETPGKEYNKRLDILTAAAAEFANGRFIAASDRLYKSRKDFNKAISRMKIKGHMNAPAYELEQEWQEDLLRAFKGLFRETVYQEESAEVRTYYGSIQAVKWWKEYDLTEGIVKAYDIVSQGMQKNIEDMERQNALPEGGKSLE